jgi:hypothetical protein
LEFGVCVWLDRIVKAFRLGMIMFVDTLHIAYSEPFIRKEASNQVPEGFGPGRTRLSVVWVLPRSRDARGVLFGK